MHPNLEQAIMLMKDVLKDPGNVAKVIKRTNEAIEKINAFAGNRSAPATENVQADAPENTEAPEPENTEATGAEDTDADAPENTEAPEPEVKAPKKGK